MAVGQMGRCRALLGALLLLVGGIGMAGAAATTTAAPPEYPFRNPDLPWAARLDDLVGRLTLEEKLQQLQHGGAAQMTPAPAVERLGIGPFVWGSECVTGLGTDGNDPHGTAFPQPLGMAATFDPALLKRAAGTIALELRAQRNFDRENGVVKFHHGLSCWSPVVNINRHPLWGRNDETFGECPVLSSFMARSFVEGIQGNHTRYYAAAAACKHLDVYGGPDNLRYVFDADVSQADLTGTFLMAFEECAAAGVMGYMCSYNSIRGVPACANYRTMTFFAREQWGFEGYVVSDQGAVFRITESHNYTANQTLGAVAALNAGCDMEDSDDAQHVAYYNLSLALDLKLTDMATIDASVSRLFYVRMRLGEFDPPENDPWRSLNMSIVSSPAHVEMARDVATASIVLLKNQNETLPLSAAAKNASYCLLGPFADNADLMMGKYSPHGSTNVTVTYRAGLAAALQNASQTASFQYLEGCTGPFCDGLDTAAVTTFIQQGCDTVLLAVGTSYHVESESLDRSNMSFPGAQPTLVQTVLEALGTKQRLVLLVSTAGPVDLAALEQDTRVAAILDLIYLGQTAGTALADILLGETSPSGRLVSDVPPIDDYTMQGRTYRFAQADVLFPFGYGLSYTQFNLSHLAAPYILPVCQALRLSVNVTNTGRLSGAIPLQVYVEWPNAVGGPIRQLATTTRVFVDAASSKTVQLSIRPRELARASDLSCFAPKAERLEGNVLQNVSNVQNHGQCCTACQQFGDRCEGYRFATDSGTCELLNELRGPVPGTVTSNYESAHVASRLELQTGPLEIFVSDQQPTGPRTTGTNVLHTRVQLSGSAFVSECL